MYSGLRSGRVIIGYTRKFIKWHLLIIFFFLFFLFLHVGLFNKESGRKILHTINKYIYNNNTNHYNMLCTFLISFRVIVRNWELWWRFRTSASASASHSLCKFASTVDHKKVTKGFVLFEVCVRDCIVYLVLYKKRIRVFGYTWK